MEKEFYLTIRDSGCIIDAQNIVGKIEFFDSSVKYRKIF